MRIKENLLNKKFGYLTVIAEQENIGNAYAWLCKCDCGNQKSIKASSLKLGKSITCGCKINKFKNNDPKQSTAIVIFNEKYSDGDLSFEEFYQLSQKNCFYCNAAPLNLRNRFKGERKNHFNQFSGENGNFIYNGLDRIDSNKKHDLDNVVTCCEDCNKSKMSMSFEEFKQWVIKGYLYKNKDIIT